MLTCVCLSKMPVPGGAAANKSSQERRTASRRTHNAYRLPCQAGNLHDSKTSWREINPLFNSTHKNPPSGPCPPARQLRLKMKWGKNTSRELTICPSLYRVDPQSCQPCSQGPSVHTERIPLRWREMINLNCPSCWLKTVAECLLAFLLWDRNDDVWRGAFLPRDTPRVSCLRII